MDIIEKTAIDLKIDLKEGNSTVMAEAGRKIYEELQDTTLKDKGWSQGKTTQYFWNKYNKKKRKKNEDEVEVAEDEVEEVAEDEDEVEVAARVPPGEITGTV